MPANVASSVACTAGLRHQAQRDLGDDRQRALRADQQLRQVVADDVLHRLRAGADDLAGRQHRFEREHVALGRAVLERARAAGALGDVAADRRLASGWPDRADRTGRALRRRPAGRAVMTLRLHDGQQVVLVDLEDAVEPLHRQDDAAAERHRAAGVARCRRRARPAARGARCTAARDGGDLARCPRASGRRRRDGRSAGRRGRRRAIAAGSTRACASPTMAVSGVARNSAVTEHGLRHGMRGARPVRSDGDAAAFAAASHELVNPGRRLRAAGRATSRRRCGRSRARRTPSPAVTATCAFLEQRLGELGRRRARRPARAASTAYGNR